MEGLHWALKKKSVINLSLEIQKGYGYLGCDFKVQKIRANYR